MNLLDTFSFIFTADIKAVKDGAKAGEKAADDVGKAMDKADKAATKVGENFLVLARNAASALGAILALGAIKTLVNDTAKQTAEVGLQARQYGIATEALSAYQRAVRTMGGSAQDATSTLAGLRDKFVEMSRFGPMMGQDALTFQQLGVSAAQMRDAIKDPTVALSAMADKFKELNQTQRLFIGQKLGLDPSTIALLAMGRVQFDAYIAKQKELGVVTQAQADAAIKYRIAQTELGMSLETVAREVITTVLPAFTWMLRKLDDIVQWMRDHKAVAIGFFGALAAVIGATLLPVIVSAAGALWALVAPVLAAAAPFVALGLAIGLVVDDIEKFMAGQNSMIGEIITRWPIIGEVARAVGEIFQMSIKLIGDVLHEFMSLVKDAASWVGDKLTGAFDKLSGVFGPVSERFKPVVDLFREMSHWIGELFDKLRDAPMDVLNWLGGMLSKATGIHFDAITGKASASDFVPKAAADAKMSGQMSATGKEIADKLVKMGWSPAQAAGIAGSFMQESGGNAGAVNPTSGAYGLGQWLGSRRKDFEAYAGKPLEGSSLDEQLQFFNYETTHKEKKAGDMLRAAKTADEAAMIHSKYYERPGEAEANNARRVAYAQMIASGQQQVQATNTPLASMSSQSIAAAAPVSNSRSITTGDVTINTQATDSQGIAASFGEHLNRHLNDALDYHDDGIAS